jgi:hypothetical protein
MKEISAVPPSDRCVSRYIFCLQTSNQSYQLNTVINKEFEFSI